MDEHTFLQYLCDHPLEEGRAYIQKHITELRDYATVGILIKDEAHRQEQIAPFVALKLSELLLFFGKLVHHAPSHAFGLIAKGNTLKTMGYHQAALECLDAAGEEFLRLGDEVGWARSRISWVISAFWLGRVEDALQEAARTRDVFLQHSEKFWLCVIDNNTAVIYTQLGRYQDAIAIYQRMLTIYPTLQDRNASLIEQYMAVAEGNQARNLAFLGNFEEAYCLQLQAQGSFVALGETRNVVTSERNLAELDYAQGYYGSALQRYYRARDILKQNNIDDPPLLASLHLKAAICLVKLNKTSEACQLAELAVKAYRHMGITLDTGQVLCEYATTLAASARLQEAVLALSEAEELFTQAGADHHTILTRLQRAELFLEMGAVADAYTTAHFVKEFADARMLIACSVRASLVMVAALIESALQTSMQQEQEQRLILLQQAMLLCSRTTTQARQHNLQEQVYKGQHLLGRLSALQGNFEKAARHYTAAIAQIERILAGLVHDLPPLFLRTAWTVYEDMIALCLQQRQAERAFYFLERARSVVLRRHLNKSKASSGQDDTIPATMLQAKGAALLRLQGKLEKWQNAYREYSRQLAAFDGVAPPALDREVIQAELKRCETKLSKLFERLQLLDLDIPVTPASPHNKRARYRLHTVQQVAVAQLQQRLKSDQLLLAYFLYRGSLVIFAASARHLITYENPDGAAQLERLLPLLHAHLQPGGWPDLHQPPQQPIRRLLNRLYNLLIEPVSALLPPASGYLTIVPYGPLHNLPFHALYNGSRFLVEDFQISYLPVASILTPLDPHQGDHSMSSAQSSAKCSAPLGGGQPEGAPLVFGYSGSGKLARALDEARALATLLEGRCYLEQEATIARLIEQSPGSPVIHLATHGQSRLDAPNFSSILLADGQLNALDAFRLNLKGCELVTLSGCETGLALSGGGDEQLGLGRAFLAAGAASLVMSLWPVEDNATNELMLCFYQHLLNGDSKVQALRAAQCDFINRHGSMCTHPYFWSAFRLVGDIAPLSFIDISSST